MCVCLYRGSPVITYKDRQIIRAANLNGRRNILLRAMWRTCVRMFVCMSVCVCKSVSVCVCVRSYARFGDQS